MTVAELVEEGISAYTRGDLVAAERRWRQALALVPGDERTLSYLALLGSPPAPSAPAPLREPDPFSPQEPCRGEGRATLEEYVPSPWEQEPAEAVPVVISEGEGLDLASVDEQSEVYTLVPRTPPAPAAGRQPHVEVWMRGARELSALGDFTGSLELIERILKLDPAHAEAREYLTHNEATLIAMYESKLGPPGAVPHLAISPEEVTWLSLDHRAGFLLAQIDGTVSYEDLFALSGLPRLDTARILANLLAQGVIR